MSYFIKSSLLLLLLLMGFVVPSASQDSVLYALDARRSQILQISPLTGEVLSQFSSPVLCRPEGACGLAYSGHSLFLSTLPIPTALSMSLNPMAGPLGIVFPRLGPR